MLRVATMEAELLLNVQPGVGGNTVHTGPAIVGISGNSGVFDDSEISQHGSSTGSLPTAVLFGTAGSEISPAPTSSERSQSSSTAKSASGGAAEGHDSTEGAISGVPELTFCSSGVSPPSTVFGTSGVLPLRSRGVTDVKRNGRGGSPREIPAEMDQQQCAPGQQGTAAEHSGAWTPVLQNKGTPAESNQREMWEIQNA